ncbi:acetamidase/formamidase family protein [Nitrincola alkalisediminis]|uniref:acetamidase/formamidase family protein n=1 Tax=Nitrincola alkalisediminis TaxID=1366656 RepID=UPI00187476B9|nr:acetamidase/formamidase family protein [Nitrincola alkalisediminis]
MTEHICTSSCTHGISAESKKDVTEEFDTARRSFIRNAFVGGGAVSLGAMGVSMSPMSYASTGTSSNTVDADAPGPMHYYIPATPETVLWGYFSKIAKPVVEIESGDFVTIETLTHHANDDAERMVKGDPGAESIFHWDAQRKGVDRRGAGPMDAAIGAGGGAGVHICTGPVRIQGAQPGDILEVRIADVTPRPSGNPDFKGKSFGSNAAAWWGFHYGDMLTEPKKREVVTIYEVDARGERNWAKAVYNYRWTPQTDPFGVVHPTIDYPGVPVDHRTISKRDNILRDIRIPIRPHFGTIGVAPAEADIVNSIPPSYTGGNIDNWRIGKGAKLYFPVAVEGAMFSVGDPHASQGDSELCGTAIECSLTGTFQFILHKKADLPGTALAELNYPLLETQDDWVLHGFSYANYLAELGPNAQEDIYSKSSVDKALRDAYRKMRHFLMTTQQLDEDEAISLMSVAVDFGITQVVDGNWGVHAILKKSMFPARGRS